MVEICHSCKEYKALNANIVLFSKRRGLIKEAIKQMVKRALSVLDEMDYEAKMELIDTLLKVTEGKIFVEKQRARLVLVLAHIREKEGRIAEAAKIIQEVQVETFGALNPTKKKQNIFWNKCDCAWKKRTTLEHNLSVKRFILKFLPKQILNKLKSNSII